MNPEPANLNELQLASITKAITNPSIKQFVKFIANHPDSTTAKVLGQTGIDDIVEANHIAAEHLFKKGYFLCYQLTGNQSNLREHWRIAKIPDHAEHCQSADELSNYVNQLGQVLNANQDLRGEA
jgi:hypothetical protein